MCGWRVKLGNTSALAENVRFGWLNHHHFIIIISLCSVQLNVLTVWVTFNVMLSHSTHPIWPDNINYFTIPIFLICLLKSKSKTSEGLTLTKPKYSISVLGPVFGILSLTCVLVLCPSVLPVRGDPWSLFSVNIWSCYPDCKVPSSPQEQTNSISPCQSAALRETKLSAETNRDRQHEKERRRKRQTNSGEAKREKWLKISEAWCIGNSEWGENIKEMEKGCRQRETLGSDWESEGGERKRKKEEIWSLIQTEKDGEKNGVWQGERKM